MIWNIAEFGVVAAICIFAFWKTIAPSGGSWYNSKVISPDRPLENP
jgi:hypothetical protein